MFHWNETKQQANRNGKKHDRETQHAGAITPLIRLLDVPINPPLSDPLSVCLCLDTVRLLLDFPLLCLLHCVACAFAHYFGKIIHIVR